MARRLGRPIGIRIAYEGTFGTPEGDGYFAPEFYQFTPPADPDFVDDPVLGGTWDNARDAVAPLRALPGGSFSLELPFDLGMLGHYIRMLCGAPSASGSSPNYTHVVDSGGETLESVTVQAVYASDDVLQLNGCKLNTLSLDLAKDAAYQRIMLNFECRDWSHGSAVLSGSAASMPTVQKLTKYAASVKWNGSIIGEALAATFSHGNALERYNTLSGDAYPSQIDTGLGSIGGTLRVRSLANTWRGRSKGDTVDDLALVFALPADATNRNLTITMPATRVKSDGDPVQGPGGIDGSLSFRAEQTSGAAAATYTLKNGHASYA